MPDLDRATITSIDFRSALPFTHLFRSFRVAIHPSKLILGLALIFSLYCGGRIMDALWPAKYLPTRAEMGMSWQESSVLEEKVGPFVAFFHLQGERLNEIPKAVIRGEPADVVNAVTQLVFAGPRDAFVRNPVYFGIFSIWFLFNWSIFGGAIARIAAVHVARDEKMSIRNALRFSTGKLVSFVFAPLIPLIIFGVVVVVVAACGLALYIPGIGPVALTLVFPLTLAVGLVMTLVLFGTLGGFNLMFPTIAVEGSDSFDAISRSFSYVYARPWRMAFHTLVAVIYGALTYLFLRLFIVTMLCLVHYFETWFLVKDSTAYIGWQAMWRRPELFQIPYEIQWSKLNGGQAIGAGILAFWIYLIVGILGGYVISFYFSANTIIYCLLRRDVDATELDDVFLEQDESEFPDAAQIEITVESTQAPPEPEIAPTGPPIPAETPPPAG